MFIDECYKISVLTIWWHFEWTANFGENQMRQSKFRFCVMRFGVLVQSAFPTTHEWQTDDSMYYSCGGPRATLCRAMLNKRLEHVIFDDMLKPLGPAFGVGRLETPIVYSGILHFITCRGPRGISVTTSFSPLVIQQRLAPNVVWKPYRPILLPEIYELATCRTCNTFEKWCSIFSHLF